MAQPKDFFSTRPGLLRLGVNGPYSVLETQARERAPDTGAAGAGSAATVPCLNTHISTETTPPVEEQALEIPEVQYSKGRQKTAFILSESVQKLCRLHGIDRVAF